MKECVCENCGAPIDDPMPAYYGQLMSMKAAGIVDLSEIPSMPRFICDDCNREALRLQRQARELYRTISHTAESDFKRYGAQKREERR